MSRPKRSTTEIAGLATLLLLLVLVACGDNSGKGDEPTATSTPTPAVTPTPVTPTPEPVYDVEEARAELATARKRWESNGSADYDLESLVVCRCPEGNRPLKITVRNGAIESVIDLESGRALTIAEYVDVYTYKTVEGRFDQIERALSDPWPVHHLRAEYHPNLGYPTSLGINYRHDVIGYGFSLERLVYKPLDPSPTPATSTLSLDMEGRHTSVFDLFSGGDAMSSVGPAATVEEVIEKGLRLAGASPVHLVIRGTAVADSARCDWRGIARTAGQREDAIRFWLELDADDEIPNAAYLEGLFTITLDTLDPNFRETAKSNFLAIARGGLSEEYLFLSCFADYSVSEYLLGTGPASLSVAYDRRGEARSYGLYLREHAADEFGPATSTPLMSEGDYQTYLDGMVRDAEAALAEILEGREAVVFLAPMGAHGTIAVEAWQAVAQWDVQRAEDGTLHAVRYGAREVDPEHTQTLANLKSRITAATTATSTTATSTATSTTANSTTATSTAATTTRIATVSGLNQYYHNIGAADGMDGGYSDTIAIIDNPILIGGQANGDSRSAPAGEGQALLGWDRIAGVVGGEYTIRTRKLFPSEHWETNWSLVGYDVEQPSLECVDFCLSLPDKVFRDPNPSGPTNSSLTYTREKLELGEIYGVQLNYKTASGGVTTQVFSARDAYVWPSKGFPGDDDRPDRVATFPYFGHHADKDYGYRICEDTFYPEDLPNTNRRDAWVDLIEHALEQWETATDGLVTVTPEYINAATYKPCTDMSLLRLMLFVRPEDDARSEIRMLDVNVLEAFFASQEIASDPFKKCILGGTACVTSRVDYSRDDRKVSNELSGVDIVFNKSSFDDSDLSLPTNVNDIGFNTCLPGKDAGHRAFRIAVHEAGHALGLSNVTETWKYYVDALTPFNPFESDVYEASHSTIPDSVMNYDGEVAYRPDWKGFEPDCSPHPFDILAIYALYQGLP